MAKKLKNFFQFDAQGVYIGPVEAEECPENATASTPTGVGTDGKTPVWDGKEWTLTPNEDIIKATEVRVKRNALLNGSDFSQLADATVDVKEWAGYRQQLRDVTKQKGFPNAVEWPVEPSKKPVAVEPAKK